MYLRILFAAFLVIGSMPTLALSTAQAESAAKEKATTPPTPEQIAARQRMKECGDKWRAMKEANKTEGMTWRTFSEDCLKPDEVLFGKIKWGGSRCYEDIDKRIAASEPRFVISANISPIDSTHPVPNKYFTEEALLKRMLNYIRAKVSLYCEREFRTAKDIGHLGSLVHDRNNRKISALPSGYQVKTIGGGFIAYSPGTTGQWTVLENYVVDAERRRKQQEEARQREEVERQRIASEKQAIREAIREKLISQFGVQAFANEQAVAANPFIYRGKIVGVHSIFRRMLSESEALFFWSHTGQHAIFVTGVPATRFPGETPVVLALKVLGTKVVKVAGGEVTLPFGQFVGVHECRNSSCDEFYD